MTKKTFFSDLNWAKKKSKNQPTDIDQLSIVYFVPNFALHHVQNCVLALEGMAVGYQAMHFEVVLNV
jgi:hypothetical protein